LNPEEQGENNDQTEHSDPGKGALVFQFDEGVDHQDEKAESDNDDFEKVDWHEGQRSEISNQWSVIGSPG
jgi:hypothetical protein